MKDYFSIQAKAYAESRPVYPVELIEFITGLCKERKVAWDCGTGNGQVAAFLADYFEKVIATDASREQIENAIKKPNIIYLAAKAEEQDLANASVDLITVATAIHWFDIEKFYSEADRILKSGGILAVWGYAGCTISDTLDPILNHYTFEILKDYWPKETFLNLIDHYKILHFPYKEIEAPTFTMEAERDFNWLLNYLFSWSGTQEFIKKNNNNPVEQIKDELLIQWGNPEYKKVVKWKLFLKCGRKP